MTLILPAAVWVLLQNVYYKVSISGSIRNGVLCYLRSLPATLLLLLLTALPPFLVLSFVPVLVRYPLLLLLAVFWVVPMTMVWLLYASHLFDRTINRETYPEICRRGLRPLPPEPDAHGDGSAEDKAGPSR